MSIHDATALVPAGLTNEYLRYHRVCPAGLRDDGTLRLLVAPDALLADAVPELEHAYGTAVQVEEASWQTIHDAIARLGQDDSETQPAPDELDADLRDLATQPPVIRYVNAIIRDAVDAGASDVHLEAVKDGAVARLRIDGVPTRNKRPAAPFSTSVCQRLCYHHFASPAGPRTGQDQETSQPRSAGKPREFAYIHSTESQLRAKVRRRRKGNRIIDPTTP